MVLDVFLWDRAFRAPGLEGSGGCFGALSLGF